MGRLGTAALLQHIGNRPFVLAIDASGSNIGSVRDRLDKAIQNLAIGLPDVPFDVWFFTDAVTGPYRVTSPTDLHTTMQFFQAHGPSILEPIFNKKLVTRDPNALVVILVDDHVTYNYEKERTTKLPMNAAFYVYGVSGNMYVEYENGRVFHMENIQ